MTILQLMMRPLGQLAGLFVYKSRKDPIREYKMITRGIVSKATTGKILIAPINCGPNHTFEGLFARKAAMKGKEVYFLFCDQAFSKCENIDLNLRHKLLTCAWCVAEQHRFQKCYGGKSLSIRNLCEVEDEKMVAKAIAALAKTNGVNSSYRVLDVDIVPILLTGLQRHYLMAEPPLASNSITKGFIATIVKAILATHRACKMVKPEYVVMSHGTYSTWGAVLQYCKCHDIRCVTWGRGYNDAGVIFSHDESYLIEPMLENDDRWMNIQFGDSERKIAESYYSSRIAGVMNYRSTDYNRNNKKIISRDDLFALLEIPLNKNIVGVFPNIPWDGQVFGQAEVFSSFKAWLLETVKYLGQVEDVCCLIRCHPAEKKMQEHGMLETVTSVLWSAFGDLPENVRIIPADSPISSYAVGCHSLFGVSYASTICTELTYMRIPTIVAGNIAYKNKGITYDPTSIDAYNEMLDMGVRRELRVTNSNIESLLKYSYHYLYRKTMPDKLIDIDGNLDFLGFQFSSENELNGSVPMEYLYSRCEDGGYFDFSRFWGSSVPNNTDRLNNP